MLNLNRSKRTEIPLNLTETGRNEVLLLGKVSRVGRLQYTPSGAPIGEVELAVPQTHFEKTEVGYFEVVFLGPLAEHWLPRLAIGNFIEVTGKLWSRQFKNRQGTSVKETKVIVSQATVK